MTALKYRWYNFLLLKVGNEKPRANFKYNLYEMTFFHSQPFCQPRSVAPIWQLQKKVGSIFKKNIYGNLGVGKL